MDEVPPLATVLEHPRCRTALQRGPEQRGDTGVGGVTRHPGPVHVVVAQRGHPPADGPRPREGQVLLRELGGGVDVARIKRGVLGHQAGGERLTALWAGRFEASRRQVGHRARPRPYGTVLRALVASFSVDHHRTRQHQAPYPGLGHAGQQHRGTQVVAAHVGGGVGEVLAEPDHRRLMADGVHTPQGLACLKSAPSGIGGGVRCAAGNSASSTRTSCPAPVRAVTTCDPMKPAPPVTRINMPPTVRPRARPATVRRRSVRGS